MWSSIVRGRLVLDHRVPGRAGPRPAGARARRPGSARACLPASHPGTATRYDGTRLRVPSATGPWARAPGLRQHQKARQALQSRQEYHQCGYTKVVPEAGHCAEASSPASAPSPHVTNSVLRRPNRPASPAAADPQRGQADDRQPGTEPGARQSSLVSDRGAADNVTERPGDVAQGGHHPDLAESRGQRSYRPLATARSFQRGSSRELARADGPVTGPPPPWP